MKQVNNIFYRFLSASMALVLFSSCGSKITPNSSQPKKSITVKLNTQPVQKKTNEKTGNDSTITYRAEYGVTYEIIGNVIAKYPHFDLSIFNKKSIPASDDQITTYELTGKDGFAKTHIISDTRQQDKKHFYLENFHFYYHSNAADRINIYMPPQLLADR